MVGITDAAGAAAGAYTADTANGKDRVHHFGLMSACFGVGMVAGPTVGGLLGAIPFCLARFGDGGESL